MECTINLSDEVIAQQFKTITQDEFAEFCMDAVASALFTWQFTPKTNKEIQDTAKMSLSELRKIHRKFHYNGPALDQWRSIVADILKEEAPNNKQNKWRTNDGTRD